MNAPALSAGRRGRFSAWFGAPAASPVNLVVAPETDSRQCVERRLYDEIGEFLFTHGLSPSPAHFEIAHAYLAGSDPVVARQVAAMIAEHGTVDRASIAALIRPQHSGPHTLADLASRLETQLAECLHAADRSHSSARDYGDALDIAQSRLESDPGGTLAHIAGLTREVVSTTRLVEAELNQTRRETERLRGDLDRAREAAECDHLTGLPNRRGLERRLAELIARRRGPGPVPRVTIALCDIDDFKGVNDVHGHQAGDRVLKFVGKFLSSELGHAACVTRHGGEEFAILIEGHSPHEAMMLLDDVRERLSARSLINQDTGQPIGRVTFSAGIAALDGDGQRTLNDADIALYQAKRSGKNTVNVAAAHRD
jgi:diguanylate cyclase